jgi:hypothetical protein
MLKYGYHSLTLKIFDFVIIITNCGDSCLFRLILNSANILKEIELIYLQSVLLNKRNMDDKQKEIKSLGEFGLIELLTSDIELKNKTSVVGIGDDAAVADYGNKQVVITTDILAEGVHFNLIYTPC